MVQGADMIKTINVFEKFGQGDAKKVLDFFVRRLIPSC